MKIVCVCIGKTTDEYLKKGISIYENRIKNYLSFESITLPEIKKPAGMTINQQTILESRAFLNVISGNDLVVLLDEHGKEYTSVEFSGFLQKQFLLSLKRMVFIIGGPYGFSDEMYARTNEKVSLSQLTFSHQMVRLFFLEQIYRAMTILKNEPYHH